MSWTIDCVNIFITITYMQNVNPFTRINVYSWIDSLCKKYLLWNQIFLPQCLWRWFWGWGRINSSWGRNGSKNLIDILIHDRIFKFRINQRNSYIYFYIKPYWLYIDPVLTLWRRVKQYMLKIWTCACSTEETFSSF